MQIGRLCEVSTTFINSYDLRSSQTSSTTVPLYVAFSELDHGSSLKLIEDGDKTLYRLPVGWAKQGGPEGLMPLRAFVEKGLATLGVRLVVCVKDVGHSSVSGCEIWGSCNNY